MRKNITLIIAILSLMVVSVSCSKSKTCRCSVLGTTNVRIFDIEKGDCESIKYYTYHDEVENILVDSLLCTGYEFPIDTIFKQQ